MTVQQATAQAAINFLALHGAKLLCIAVPPQTTARSTPSARIDSVREKLTAAVADDRTKGFWRIFEDSHEDALSAFVRVSADPSLAVASVLTSITFSAAGSRS